MAKSNAERQREYRERKKQREIDLLVNKYEQIIPAMTTKAIPAAASPSPTTTNSSKKLPETFVCVQEVVDYIKRHNIKSFNIDNPKFRSIQIERIIIILKDLYGV